MTHTQNPLSTLSNFKPNEFGLLILDITAKMNGCTKNIDGRASFYHSIEEYHKEFKESFPVMKF